MKTLCIAGAQSIEFDHVSALLFSAGLEQAKPVEGESNIGMEEWHHNAVGALKQKKTPGRLWEQLASDLLLANLHHPQWGWANTKTTEALEFWVQMDSRINFLLLTCDPDEYLAQCLLRDPGEQIKTEQSYLKRWQDEHQKMLAFYLEHADRCMLVNARKAAANPKALADKLAECWQFELNMEHASLPLLSNASPAAAPTTLARHIAGQILREHGKHLFSLNNELQAAQQPLEVSEAVEDNVQSANKISLATLLRDYQRRCEQDLSENERQELNKLRQKLKEAKQHTPPKQQHIQSKQGISQKDSELLLLELHQSQEEVEHYFLQHQQKSDEAEQLKQENRKLKQQYKLAKEEASAPKGLFARKPQKATPQLEFEGIQLRNEQVNPDYEHLWIYLQSPSFGERLVDQWHFRISSAGVKPGEFGQQPKLELPEQSDQLLTHWFAESESEQGRKLELRFALPSAMDTGVWKKLNSNDQQLIKALLRQIPNIISELKSQNTYIHRNWEDWEALASNMQKILQAKVGK